MTTANIAHPGAPSKIPHSGLEPTIQKLRSIAEQSCCGLTARRALRLAELLSEVVEPAVIALEYGTASPTAPPHAAPIHPSNGSRPESCSDQGWLFDSQQELK